MEIESSSTFSASTKQDQLCNQCKKSFINKDDLLEHIKIDHKLSYSDQTSKNLNISNNQELPQQSDFQYSLLQPFPPDPTTKSITKSSSISQTRVMMNTLETVLKKMETLEKFFHQQKMESKSQ